MINYLFTIIFAIILLLSFTGWGNFLCQSILRLQQTAIIFQTILGIALSLALGGVLNELKIISTPLLVIYLLIGIALVIKTQITGQQQYFNIKDQLVALTRPGIRSLSFLILIIFLGLSINLIPSYDDHAAYFVYPLKMLQQGTLGEDLFSQRRLFFLGGQCFLQALVLIKGELTHLHLIDPGLGLILCVGLGACLGKRLNINPRILFISGILFILLITGHIASIELNLSTFLLAPAMIVALYLISTDEQISGIKRSILQGLLLAGILCLKLTYTSFVLSYFVMYSCLYVLSTKTRTKALIELGMTFLVTVMALWPWMINSYQSTGTMMFPLLGTGFHAMTYGYFKQQPIPLNIIGQFLIREMTHPILLANTLLMFVGLKGSLRQNVGLISLFVSTLIFTAVTDFFTPYRPYAYPLLMVSFIVFVYEAIGNIYQKTGNIKKVVITIALMMFVFGNVTTIRQGINVTFFEYPPKIFQSFNHPISKVYPREMELQYRKAQDSLPMNTKIIVHVEAPSLFDFKRNNIYLVDFLSLGPKGGMPITQAPEKIAQYLSSLGIRYAIYSHALDQGLLQNPPPWMLQYTWLRQEIGLTRRLQEALIALSQRHQCIYNDGTLVIIDLARIK